MKVIDHIADFLFERDETEITIPFLSFESIKGVFDTIRNYGLCAGVALAGHFTGDKFHDAFGTTTQWIFFSLALILLILNTIYFVEGMLRTRLFRNSSATLVVSFCLLIFCINIGIIYTFVQLIIATTGHV
jgi:hypothetical protein